MTSPHLRSADVPLPGARSGGTHALIDHPSDAIGKVLCASSDVDVDGRPLAHALPEGGPIGRAILAAFLGGGLGLCAGAALVALDVVGLLGLVASTVLATAFFGWLSWSRSRRTAGPKGTCVYVGTDGAEQVTLLAGQLTRTLVRYGDVPHTRRATYKMMSASGHHDHNVDTIGFLDASLRPVLEITGTVPPAGAPSLTVLLVRELAAAAAAVRAPAMAERLARGEPLTFPVLRDEQFHGNYAVGPYSIRWHHDRLAIALPRRAPFELPTSAIRDVTLRDGQLELAPLDPRSAGVSVALAHVADGHVLHALLGATLRVPASATA
jgi:hypothetical protein